MTAATPSKSRSNKSAAAKADAAPATPKAAANGKGKTTKADTPVAPTSNVPQTIETVIGDYKIVIEGTPDSAIAKVIRSESDIILDQEFSREKLPEIVGNSKEVDAIENARIKAIAAYHQAVATTDGLVDLNALVEHPYNSLIYGENESVDDLVALLEKEDGQVFKMTINDKGQPLAGNRRRKAAEIVNQKCIANGQPPKFEFVPVEVLKFDSPEAEFKYMILHNQGRNKNKTQLAREVKNLIALAHSSAIPAEQRMGSSEMIDRLRETLGTDGRAATRSTAFNAQKAIKAVETYQNQELKQEIEAFAVTVPNKAADLVQAAPPKTLELSKEDYQAKVLERLKANPSESVKRATDAINKELVAEQLNAANGVSKDDIAKLIEAAKAAGDRPSDNRKTPQDILGLALDGMQHIDLDSFAMLTDPEYVPATKHYTILDDAFKQKHEGNVFSNPPYSKSSEALALHDAEICNGHTKKLFLVLPVSVQSTKAYHKMLKDHNPMILQPSKRLAFEPGDLLKSEDPNATAEGNREPSVIIFWSSDDNDYANFHDSAINYGWVGRQYAPFNPFQLPGVFASLKWYEENGALSCNVFGNHVQVLTAEGGNGFNVKVNNDLDEAVYPTQDSAKWIGIMAAIASLAPATPF